MGTKKEFGNLWLESIKFNLIIFIIFLLPFLLLIESHYVPVSGKFGFNVFTALIFLICPILSTFFCYLSLSNIKIGPIELWYTYRFFPILGYLLLSFLIPLIFGNLGLAYGLFFFILFIPFLYAYIVTEIFHYKNKQFKKN